jgi:hypothetical protein
MRGKEFACVIKNVYKAANTGISIVVRDGDRIKSSGNYN